ATAVALALLATGAAKHDIPHALRSDERKGVRCRLVHNCLSRHSRLRAFTLCSAFQESTTWRSTTRSWIGPRFASSRRAMSGAPVTWPTATLAQPGDRACA